MLQTTCHELFLQMTCITMEYCANIWKCMSTQPHLLLDRAVLQLIPLLLDEHLVVLSLREGLGVDDLQRSRYHCELGTAPNITTLKHIETIKPHYRDDTG